MSGAYIYYIEGNIVCTIIFAVMIAHDLVHKDRDEKQIKFDHTLMCFMLYFISDVIWACMESGLIVKNDITFAMVSFVNSIILAAITYTWLLYVMAVEQIPGRDSMVKKIAIVFPVIVSQLLLAILYVLTPQALIDENMELQPAYDVIMNSVTYIYLTAIVIYAVRQAGREKSRILKRKHLIIGFLPLMVAACGLVQIVFFPNRPLFCFSAAILMLIFYIEGLENQISVDPLTGLNNRGYMMNYMVQEFVSQKEGSISYVIMLDVNDFKMINDNYGHAEGDRALILIANTLKKVVGQCRAAAFLGRYGGDEFIIIVHTEEEDLVISMIDQIKEDLGLACKKEGVPYLVSLSIGYDQLMAGRDSFEASMRRADQEMYDNKKRYKQENRSRVTT